jgi:group I intron endonuclease
MKSGIYKITNKRTEVSYIGSSIDINDRFNQHIRQLNSNSHYNDKFQKAWNKYGQSEFIFEVIEYVEIEYLLIKEQYYLDNLLFANENNDKFSLLAYNINRNSNNTLGFKFSEESKEKMSQSKLKYKKELFIPSEEEIEKSIYHIEGYPVTQNKDINNPFFGKTHTDESKFIMSEKKRGENNFFYKKKGPMYGKKQTPNSKRKISVANSGKNNKKSKPILQIDLNGNIVKIWDSSGQAAKILGISQANINQCCNNKRRTANGYKWQFKCM